MTDNLAIHGQVTNENRFVHIGDQVSFFCNETSGFVFSSVSGFGRSFCRSVRCRLRSDRSPYTGLEASSHATKQNIGLVDNKVWPCDRSALLM